MNSERFDRQEYYYWKRKLDWQKLAAFELAGLYPRGLFVIFLAMLTQSEEMCAPGSPLEEARVKTLLQGLVHAVFSLLNDWEDAITEFCAVGSTEEHLLELAQVQLLSFADVRQTLKSTVKCFRSQSGLRFDGGFCKRDVQNNILIVSKRSPSNPDQAEFLSFQMLMSALADAFSAAPDAYGMN